MTCVNLSCADCKCLNSDQFVEIELKEHFWNDSITLWHFRTLVLFALKQLFKMFSSSTQSCGGALTGIILAFTEAAFMKV